MPDDMNPVTLAGEVTDIFGHRFVLGTPEGKVLADLGPEGIDKVALVAGAAVVLTGRRKPSEIKVSSITLDGRTVTFDHDKKDKPSGHKKHEGKADDAPALKAVKEAGYEVVGAPRRKPKHVEILGRRGEDYAELHVTFDGAIRKTKPATPPATGDAS